MPRLQSLFFAVVAMLLSAATCFADPIDVTQYKNRIRVACVGDSITAGAGTTSGNSYPQQLGKMLGDKWEVRNFGVSGATLLNAGDKPYQKTGPFKQAVDYKADVIIIMLGTNDTKAQNWKSIDAFPADYKDLVVKLTAPDTKPHFFIARPCVVLGKGGFGIVEASILKEIPMLDAIAKDVGGEIVDIHAATEAALKTKPGLIPDNVHPNSDGAAVLASTFYKSLTGKEYTGPTTVLPPPPPKPAATQPTTTHPAK